MWLYPVRASSRCSNCVEKCVCSLLGLWRCHGGAEPVAVLAIEFFRKIRNAAADLLCHPILPVKDHIFGSVQHEQQPVAPGANKFGALGSTALLSSRNPSPFTELMGPPSVPMLMSLYRVCCAAS